MKKLALILSSILLINMITVPLYAATTKDETIYVQLDGNGSIKSMQVVNHLYSNEATQIFEDITTSNSIENLTDTTGSVLNNNSIRFNLGKTTNNLYYKSDSDMELPFTYEFKYFLDGMEITSNDLAGVNGKVDIKIHIEPNQKAPSIYHENMMTQLSINLDMSKASDIIAKEATKLVTGQLTTLNFIVLAGHSGNFELNFNAKNFEMDSWTLSIIPNNFSLPQDMNDELNNMTDGFNQMSDGMGELIAGTEELKTGLVDLTKGVNELNSGYNVFIQSTKTFINGLISFLDGFTPLGSGFNLLAEKSSSIESGLAELSINANTMSTSYVQIQQAYSDLSTGHSELTTLAESLLSSNDPLVVALAEGVIAEQSGLDTLNSKFSQINYGMASYTEGINTLSENFNQFNAGIQETKTGLSQLILGADQTKLGAISYQNGALSIGDGVNELDTKVNILPDSVQQLIDGQNEFKNRIDESSDEITNQINKLIANESVDFPSFVNGEKQIVDSIQFILKTPAIEIEEEKILDVVVVEKKGFIQRLLDLFR